VALKKRKTPLPKTPSHITTGGQVTAGTGKTHGLGDFDMQVIFFQDIPRHFREFQQPLGAWPGCQNLPFPLGRDGYRAENSNDPHFCEVCNTFSDAFIGLTKPDDNV